MSGNLTKGRGMAHSQGKIM